VDRNAAKEKCELEEEEFPELGETEANRLMIETFVEECINFRVK